MNENDLTYARPMTWDELNDLQKDYSGRIMYLAGGDYHPKVREGAAILIDLQDLELDQVICIDNMTLFGGLVSLQQLGDALDSADLQEAISIEAGINLRNSLSLTNYVKSSNGRSSVQLCLNALEASYRLVGEDNPETFSLDLKKKLSESFIEEMQIQNPVSLAFAAVGRSPKDQPVVAVAASKRSDSRIHVACGGLEGMWAEFDIFYGDDDGETTIRNLYRGAEDAWAGAEYRQEAAAVLLSRCLQKLWKETNSKEEA